MKSFKLFLLTIFLAAGISVAQEDLSHPDAGVTITLPAGWFYEADETTLSVYTEDESVNFTFIIIPTDDINAALGEVDKVLASEFESVELDEATEGEVNGLQTLSVEGVADGLSLLCEIIETPVKGNTLFAFAVGEPASVQKHSADVGTILTSIRSTK